MKLITLAGIALIAVGAFLLIRGGLTTKRDVLSVGELKITAEEQRPISPWIAGVVFVAGIGLVVTGVRRKA